MRQYHFVHKNLKAYLVKRGFNPKHIEKFLTNFYSSLTFAGHEVNVTYGK